MGRVRTRGRHTRNAMVTTVLAVALTVAGGVSSGATGAGVLGVGPGGDTGGPGTPATMFTDVPTTQPFHREITWLADRGVTTGYLQPDGTRLFKPVDPVARDAMAAFMYRLAGSPAFTPPATSPFTDVATDRVFYKEITWLAAEGISTGYAQPDGTKQFKPLDPVARDAMAAFMYRYAHQPAYTAPATSPFTDVANNRVFYKEISWLADRGTESFTQITNGNDFSDLPAISADGRFVAFYSDATNLVAGDTNQTTDVFRWDRTANATVRITNGNRGSARPTISADGSSIAYESWASDLVPGDTNDTADIFAWDRSAR